MSTSRFHRIGRRARSGAIAIATLILLVGVIPARAETPHHEIAVPTITDGAAIRSDAGAYAERFNVTVDEAVRRLDTIPTAATALATLESAFPDRFAGGWVEHEPSFLVVVRLTGPNDVTDAVEPILTPIGIPSDLRFGAMHPVAELHAALNRIAPTIDEQYPQTGMYVDPATGSVVLRGPDAFTEAALNALSEVAGVPLRAEAVGAISPQHHYGGHRIDTGVGGCTTGFSVYDAVYGTRGVLTAGHCAQGVGSFATYYDVSPNPAYSVEMRGKRDDANQDFAWYKNESHLAVPQFFSGGDYRNVTGTILRTQMSGNWVCHYGRTTGYSCGIVDTIRYRPPPHICNGQTCSDRWPAIFDDPYIECFSGDSGGPYFYGTVAWGTHTAGPDVGLDPGDCHTAVFMSAEQLTWDGVNTRILLAN